MTATLLLLADKPASIGTGALLTLVLPLGVTVIALGIWYYAARRSGMAPESSEFGEQDADLGPGPAPQ
jgi:hypothetical protein